jgi:lipopolysaccharide export system protein LptA
MYGDDMNHPRVRNNKATGPGRPGAVRRQGAMLALLFVFCLPGALAQPTGAQGPVEIESDQAEFEQQSGISRYRGRVRVTRDGVVIEGDELVITPGENNEYLHFSMRGTPATYEETRQDQPPINARASHMQYSEADNMLLLEGSARVIRGRDVLHGEQISYERDAGRIRATGGDGPDDRVRILINPEEGD